MKTVSVTPDMSENPSRGLGPRHISHLKVTDLRLQSMPHTTTNARCHTVYVMVFIQTSPQTCRTNTLTPVTYPGSPAVSPCCLRVSFPASGGLSQRSCSQILQQVGLKTLVVLNNFGYCDASSVVYLPSGFGALKD